MTRTRSLARLAAGTILFCSAAAATSGPARQARAQGTVSSPSRPTCAASAVKAFVEWAGRDPATVPFEERHAFVVRALELMAAAADEVIVQRPTATEDATRHRRALLNRTRELADAPARRHSDLARAAFREGAALMRVLAERDRSGSAPHEARLAALARAGRAIDSLSPLGRQPDAIQHYFRHATAAMTVLAESSGVNGPSSPLCSSRRAHRTLAKNREIAVRL